MAAKTGPALDDSIATVRVSTLAPGAIERQRVDSVAVEAPLEVRIGGKPTTVLMRTPGSDEELVAGFLFGEGMIAGPADILSIRRPAETSESERGNVIDIELTNPGKSTMLDRLFFSNSSCGVCGKKTIGSIQVNARPSDSKLKISRSKLMALPAKLRAAQSAFAVTGGVHASGLFTPTGELVALREDVGRHNALDKLIGWALAARRIPLSDYVLLVSGRVSYEIVQKAACAGVPIVAAVGAPSSIAIELAEQFNLTLVGFLRAESMNIYANGWRIAE
jgi:FdhD protein